MGDVELHLPPDVAYVGLARLVVVAAARGAGMDDARVEDLRIAVSEATANAVHAHQLAERALPVVLVFGPSGSGAFEVTVVDAGPGFEPGGPDQLAARDWQMESGLGVTLIRGLADAVAFSRGEGMRVSMTFAVGLDAPGPELDDDELGGVEAPAV